MIRTAFALPDCKRWTGGYQYFVNLFRALHGYGRRRVLPVVFVENGTPVEVLARLQARGAEVVPSNLDHFRSQFVSTLIAGFDRKALMAYRDQKIDVIFESATWHGWRFPIPVVSWLPDFQHRRLPGMFSRAAWLRREIGFRFQIASAACVMLSSEAARADCEHLYPSSRNRTSVVPFAVDPGHIAFAVSEYEVRKRYQLSGPYFYLPNQFWRHKNHGVAVEALALMRARGLNACIVASGSSVDPRHPGMFDELVEHVRRRSLEHHFRFVKFLPRADVYALMRASLAVINPSFFEGWSTTVEEAKAIGVPLVLSDIAVHREQTGSDARYFDPNSADELALQLIAILECGGNDSSRNRQPALDKNIERLKTYALEFEDLIVRVSRNEETRQ